jgi:hypothetical protein
MKTQVAISDNPELFKDCRFASERSRTKGGRESEFIVGKIMTEIIEHSKIRLIEYLKFEHRK